MQITINVPSPSMTIARAQIAFYNAKYSDKPNPLNLRTKLAEKKAAKKQAEYDAYIAEAQANIGPYVPVSYTQVWA